MDTRFAGFGPLYAVCLVLGFVGTFLDRPLAAGGQLILGTSVALGLVAAGHLAMTLVALTTRESTPEARPESG